ncbi:MAG TPA: efflux RND transporter periplasmic adaptor subunit, partial [Polyangiaceae bacterium]|nr:efflux RND transporter periplasmic adaptor subunit [Polyangiaceae bacterium]
VTAGEYVRPDTRVVTLVDIDTMRLELTVPESAVTNIHEGQLVTFRVASFANEDFAATIKYVGPALRKASRDLVVEASFDNKDRRLKPGMFATARVALGTFDAPVVPKASLREAGSTKHLFVVASNKLEERIIEPGDELDGNVVVLKGVTNGEKIVARVGSEHKDGLAVE